MEFPAVLKNILIYLVEDLSNFGDNEVCSVPEFLADFDEATCIKLALIEKLRKYYLMSISFIKGKKHIFCNCKS
jgi:hypothetical protein